jgi:hypothetical protein
MYTYCSWNSDFSRPLLLLDIGYHFDPLFIQHSETTVNETLDHSGVRLEQVFQVQGAVGDQAVEQLLREADRGVADFLRERYVVFLGLKIMVEIGFYVWLFL